MPQPLHAVGDIHVALEQIVLVSQVRVDPLSGDAFFALRLQGGGDPIRVVFKDDSAAKRERAALIETIGEARLALRPGRKQE